jgi:hypothetical protein
MNFPSDFPRLYPCECGFIHEDVILYHVSQSFFHGRQLSSLEIVSSEKVSSNSILSLLRKLINLTFGFLSSFRYTSARTDMEKVLRKENIYGRRSLRSE